MLFAHGPLGFLAAQATRSKWKKLKLDKTSTYVVMVLSFIAGIFPDVDLFYYYLVNATIPHREFITHTPFFYLVTVGSLALILNALKKPKLAFYAAIFLLGVFTHLAADMILSQIILFYPFSDAFFGLSNISTEFIQRNLLFINFFIEGTIAFFFLYSLLWIFVSKRKKRIPLTIILILIYASGVIMLSVGNQHLLHAVQNQVYADQDQDGIRNYQDTDLDGDGEANIVDLDSNADGVGNVEQITRSAERFFGVWYDPTDGGFIQIPLRLGFTTNTDYIFRLYVSAGIHLGRELEVDYENNPEGYELTPADEKFYQNKNNIYNWFSHQGRLEIGEELQSGRSLIGDILFFESGHLGMVTGFTNLGETMVLDIHKKRPAQERRIEELIADEGVITARGKMLSPAPAFEDVNLLEVQTEPAAPILKPAE